MGINSKVKMIPLIEFAFKIVAIIKTNRKLLKEKMVSFLSVFLGAKDIWILNVDTQNIEKINEIC